MITSNRAAPLGPGTGLATPLSKPTFPLHGLVGVSKAASYIAYAGAVVAATLVGAERGAALTETTQLEAVTQRASAYVEQYQRQLSSLVAEEVYVQEVKVPEARGVSPGRAIRNALAGPIKRRLRSSFMLVRVPGAGFLPFRDVFEVDGKAIHDRTDRLADLFANPSDSSLAQAQRLTEESARYNLSEVKRTINVPTFALMFLLPENLRHFSLSEDGFQTVAGHRVLSVEFRETSRPTIVKNDAQKDLPSEGRFWIDPATGTVVRTEHKLNDGGSRAQVTVTYGGEKTLTMWVPTKMEEEYREPFSANVVRGTATYGRYQRAEVSTELKVGKPPGKPPPG